MGSEAPLQTREMQSRATDSRYSSALDRSTNTGVNDLLRRGRHSRRLVKKQAAALQAARVGHHTPAHLFSSTARVRGSVELRSRCAWIAARSYTWVHAGNKGKISCKRGNKQAGSWWAGYPTAH